MRSEEGLSEFPCSWRHYSQEEGNHYLQYHIPFVWDGRGGSKWCTPQATSVCIPQVVGEYGDSEHEWQ